MNDAAIVEKVIKHDEEFKLLSSSLMALAEAQKNTNKELHSLTLALGDQKVLIEKINNMDKNINDSFKRVYRTHDELDKRLKVVEDSRNNGGCVALSTTVIKCNSNEKILDGLVIDMKDIKDIPTRLLWRFVTALVSIAAISFAIHIGLK